VASGHSRIPPRNRPAGIQVAVRYFEPSAYWMIRTRQHQLVSLYPVVTPLLVTPLYLPAVSWLNWHGWEQPRIDMVAQIMEKVSASLIASLASVIMFLVLRRDAGRWSLPLTLAFAFGSNTWVISSQALWQHGAGELFIATALYLVTAQPSAMRFTLLGVVSVLMAANRPPDGLIAGAFVLFAVSRQWRYAHWLFAGAATPLAAIFYYNFIYVGHLAGAYAFAARVENVFNLDWSGVAGMLVSPARGLLVFSPFLVFLPFGLLQRLRCRNTTTLAAMLGVAVVAQLFLYSQADWRAGVSWGPRWLTDVLPILVWMLAPAPGLLRPTIRPLFVLMIVASVCIQTVGAFWNTKASEGRAFAGDSTTKSGAWDFNNVPFLTALSQPRAFTDLFYTFQGSLDRVGSTPINNSNDIPTLKSGDELEGWALAGKHTPESLLLLIDGIVIGSTNEFQSREDVSLAMRTSAASGWRVVVNTKGVATGERVLQLAAHIEAISNFRILREQRVQVAAPEFPEAAVVSARNPVDELKLASMADRATLLLREHQRESGFWLTAHTQGLTYQAPKQEMNTFLTSTLVDLLTPVAQQRGLTDVVNRAREHLAAQIEDNGLVRYHGLPNGPGIGTLGCAITPDSDDTALVWRIATLGGEIPNDTDEPRRKAMLATLAEYRDSRGLYRTWLASPNRFQCIDPGLDPNPTDLAIQFNIYLMLHELDPNAAKNLCDSIHRSIPDEDMWVYYSKAPTIPYFRSAELQQRDCAIPLPIDRLVVPAAGQELWSEAVAQFVATMTVPPDEVRRSAIRNLLGYLGDNDFAQLRNSPPLLYHNDMSATVRRFYWSEDFGYALWLRLHEATRQDTK
jgi:hypothetical protein